MAFQTKLFSIDRLFILNLPVFISFSNVSIVVLIICLAMQISYKE